MGFWDHVVGPIFDRATEHLEQQNPGAARHESWSYDWCRFRKNRRCWYPKVRDDYGSREAGYTVWIPEDRGICPSRQVEPAKGVSCCGAWPEERRPERASRRHGSLERRRTTTFLMNIESELPTGGRRSLLDRSR